MPTSTRARATADTGRRLAAAAVATLLLLSLWPVPADAATSVSRQVCKASSGLNVRTGPSTAYRVVGTLKNGTKVSGVVTNGWIRFTSGTYAGRHSSASYLCALPRGVRTVNAPGTSVPYTRSKQVMVADRTAGSTGTHRGTWTRWEHRGTSVGWVKVSASTTARFGKYGVKEGTTRVAGDKTTPAGTYPVVFTFGTSRPSGTKTTYRKITSCSWWLGKDGIPTNEYNRWKERCGYTYPNAERMKTFSDRGLYRQGAVIGFNYYDPRTTSGKGSGSGIFLHWSPSNGYTAGCIGLTSLTELTNTVRWLDPAKKPTIVIKG